MKIYIYPNDILRKVAKDVSLNDELEKKEIIETIFKMKKTMYEAKGVGLAAPQVGVSKRFFVIDIDSKLNKDEEKKKEEITEGVFRVYINPKIIEKEGKIKCEEGCLSVPGVYEEIIRFEKIKIKYFDINLEEKEEIVEGFLAVAIQHENDHLDGKLFIDKLPVVKRTMVKKRYLKEQV
jgi:peptide deformylase